MKKFLSYGFVLIAILIVAISSHITSDNQSKLSERICINDNSTNTIANKNTDDQFNNFIFSSTIQGTELVNTLESAERTEPKFQKKASKHRKSQIAKLSALKFHSSRLYYLLRYSKLQSEGYYFFTLCKILI